MESRDPGTRAAFAKFLTRPRPAEDPVANHGDYCEPNALIHGDRIGGFIDLGNFGVTDGYDDLGQAEKSRRRNGHGDLVDLFFAEYGLPHRDRVKIDCYQTLATFFG